MLNSIFFFLFISNFLVATDFDDLLSIEKKAPSDRQTCVSLWEQSPKEEGKSTGRARGKSVKVDGLAKNAWIKQCVNTLKSDNQEKPAAEIEKPKPSRSNEGTKPQISSNVKNLKNSPLLPNTYKFTKDSELDLHGKRVSPARKLIDSFLEQAKKAGKKFVLIITGKGKHSKNVEILDDGTEVGVIKYNFLSWFQNKDFAKYIKEISYANSVHGGDGAFYVQMN